MYFDCETYIKNLHLAKEYAKTISYDENKIMKVVEFFIKSMNELGYLNKKSWSPEEIKELLNNGSMISFGRELSSGFLHANLIFGHNEKGFYVFDQLYGEYLVETNKINNVMRNKFGMCGFITIPPNFELLKKMEKNIEVCQRILNYHGITNI